MKKILSLFLVGLMLVGCSEKDTKETDWDKDKINGEVESSIEITYEAVKKFRKLEKGALVKKYIKKYDASGNETEETKYGSDGSLDYKHIYKYDGNGNKTESAKYNSDGSLDSKSVYKYDVNEEYEYSVYITAESYDFLYLSKKDDSGNEIVNTCYNSDGSLNSKRIYKYDTSGNKTEMVHLKFPSKSVAVWMSDGF